MKNQKWTEILALQMTGTMTLDNPFNCSASLCSHLSGENNGNTP